VEKKLSDILHGNYILAKRVIKVGRELYNEMMRKIFVGVLILISILGLSGGQNAWAGELEEIEKQLGDLRKSYDLSVAATVPLEKEVLALQAQIVGIEKRIVQAEKDLKELEESIFAREVDMEYQQQLLEVRVKNWYIRKQQVADWEIFLGDKSADQIRGMVYRQAAANQDKQVIVRAGEVLKKLAQDKLKVEDDKKRLAAIKKEVDSKKVFLAGEVAKAKSYQKDLTGQIASLSARQQQLLAEKTGTFSASVGEVPLVGDPNSWPDYNPGFSPAYGMFSFGAPHFKGMSQYGARGRARSGQGKDEILKAYYGDVRIETRGDLPGNINTSAGSLNLEANYLMGIAEMPSNWTENDSAALKSQAIAARTYALSYVGWRVNGGGGGGSICTSEQCQVYSGSKAGNTPDSWKRAVEETRGQIVISNKTNEIISTWYSASSGGYQESYSTLGHSTPGFWDTKCGNQSCWTGDAYEKIGESPWFYKGWYKNRSGKTCGRTHPWLNESEFADIINSVIVAVNDGAAVTHLSSTDTCLGTDPDTWSKDKVRAEADKYGGAVSKINSVDVTYGTNGVTARVKVGTDKGTREFSGNDFRTVFNVRAPGVIYLPSGLFNIEKK